MFNIKKKIYVAQDGELVDLMYERTIVLHSNYSGGLNMFDNVDDDVTNKGAVAAFNSYEDMLMNMFENDVVKFHEFLNKEEDLLIIAKKEDYALLFAQMQLELEADFGVDEEHTDMIREQQRLKDFFQGTEEMRKFCYAQNPGDSSFDRIVKQNRTDYRPSRILYRDISSLPFEIIYAMYKWGNISKTQADNKIEDIAAPLLEGQIQNVIDQSKVAIASTPEILQEYLGDANIKTVDDIIKAIYLNPLLKRLYCYERIDLVSGELDDIKRLCKIIIDKDLDFDSQPEIDMQELEFFFELYEKKDVDVIDNAKFNFISTGMIATKQAKFNAGLMMNV